MAQSMKSVLGGYKKEYNKTRKAFRKQVGLPVNKKKPFWQDNALTRMSTSSSLSSRKPKKVKPLTTKQLEQMGKAYEKAHEKKGFFGLFK